MTIESTPLFYSDAHAASLLRDGPRVVNIFVVSREPWETRYISGPAHRSPALAERLKDGERLCRAAYRIVVKAKTIRETRA